MSEDTLPHQSARTLARWTRLLMVPNTIECPSMKILGRDFEEPVFTGTGQIHIRSRTQMEFTMNATPRDGAEAFKRLVRAQKNPYNVQDQFRLLATQYDGTEWNAGWTTLRMGDTLGDTWRLSGPVSSLMTNVSGLYVAPTSSIEVVYDSKLRMPLPLNMSTSIRRGDKEVLRKSEQGGKAIEVAGTQIDFFVDPELDATWAVAATSADFPHPYAENWVSEPFCLLLGQLVFPRLVARNFGDRAAIWLRPSPLIKMDTIAASILQEDPLGAHDRFWEVYHQILTMIARSRYEDGRRNFEAHPLTHYYHEAIQATRGSNWVWCLTLASIVEGVAKLLTPEAERKSDYAPEEIEGLKTHIKAWQGDKDLRGRILNSVKLAESKGIVQILKKLKDEDTIGSDHIDAWQAVRNQVMHGELVSQGSERKLEGRMRLLTELMHRLSKKYIEQHSS